MRRVYTEYSGILHVLLRCHGHNVAQLDQLHRAGYKIMWVSSHWFNGAAWVPEVGGIHHETPGGLDDNDFEYLSNVAFIEAIRP